MGSEIKGKEQEAVWGFISRYIYTRKPYGRTGSSLPSFPLRLQEASKKTQDPIICLLPSLLLSSSASRWFLEGSSFWSPVVLLEDGESAVLRQGHREKRAVVSGGRCSPQKPHRGVRDWRQLDYFAQESRSFSLQSCRAATSFHQTLVYLLFPEFSDVIYSPLHLTYIYVQDDETSECMLWAFLPETELRICIV